MSSEKYWPFCPSLNVSNQLFHKAKCGYISNVQFPNLFLEVSYGELVSKREEVEDVVLYVVILEVVHEMSTITLQGENIFINPLGAKFFRGSINIYLHLVSFIHIDRTQVLKPS